MSTPERVDPTDPAAFDAWYDVFSVAVDDNRPYAVGWTRDELRVALTAENPYRGKEIWSLRDGGEVVGAMSLEYPLLDNLTVLNATIGVRADVRRRGYGRALGQVLDERAAAHGRSVVVTQVEVPIDSTAHTAGQSFASALGFSAANFEVHRVLELPMDRQALEGLVAEAAERHRGYELRSWRDRCPDDLVDAFAALQSTFVLEAPQGDLEVEAELYDAARVRQVEDQTREQGRSSWVAVAIAPDGNLAGYTELQVGADDTLVFQWTTLVSPAHRGHRLGLGLKARNHLELQRAHGGPAVVHTWNGAENTAMNAVNARLGFQPVERHEEWQRILPAGTLASD